MCTELVKLSSCFLSCDEVRSLAGARQPLSHEEHQRALRVRSALRSKNVMVFGLEDYMVGQDRKSNNLKVRAFSAEEAERGLGSGFLAII